jgi:hypothetical protein
MPTFVMKVIELVSVYKETFLLVGLVNLLRCIVLFKSHVDIANFTETVYHNVKNFNITHNRMEKQIVSITYIFK